VMHEATRLIGVEDVSFNLPRGYLYPTEYLY
jgi:hypothetical protein